MTAMTDAQIIAHLKSGETLNFGCNGRNAEIMALMADLENRGLIETEDMDLSQETRRTAKWIGPQENLSARAP